MKENKTEKETVAEEEQETLGQKIINILVNINLFLLLLANTSLLSLCNNSLIIPLIEDSKLKLSKWIFLQVLHLTRD